MPGDAPEEQHNRRDRSEVVMVSGVQWRQQQCKMPSKGSKRGRLLPAFRRRDRKEGESVPDTRDEQTSDEDELCPSECSETARLTPSVTDTLEPPSASPEQRRCPNKITGSCNRDFICRVLKAWSIVLAVALGFALGLAAAACEGLWHWRQWFPYRGEGSKRMNDCRKVRSGPEWPCSSPWSAPCFDHGRCAVNGSDFRVLSVYVHDKECSMTRSSEIIAGSMAGTRHDASDGMAKALRMAAMEREQLVETPEEACIVVYEVPVGDECVSSTRTWRNGQNHLILDLNDQTRIQHPSLDEKPMFAESNMRPCYFRYGYDIALPLAVRKVFYNIRGTPPEGRRYFATFKGTFYPSGDGNAEREAVLNIGQTSNDTGVVVVEHCHTNHDEQKLPTNVDLCQGLLQEYHKFDYGDLMNTTFALVPAGRSPATYRLGEVLSAGAIPVFIHDGHVKPFPGRIPWRTFSFSFSTEEADHVLETLRAVPKENLVEMQAISLGVFDEFFANGTDKIVHATLDILEERLSFQGERR